MSLIGPVGNSARAAVPITNVANVASRTPARFADDFSSIPVSLGLVVVSPKRGSAPRENGWALVLEGARALHEILGAEDRGLGQGLAVQVGRDISTPSALR